MSVSEPHAAAAAFLSPGRHGATDGEPVRLAVRDADIVQLLARKDQGATVIAAIKASLGIDLPDSQHAVTLGSTSAIWLQPEGWFLIAPRGEEGALARRVKDAVGPAGSVIDQTHGRTILTLSGARAPWVLAKHCRIDPRDLAPGRSASSIVAHAACTIHAHDGGFDLIVFTTFARDFIDMMAHAAEETGYVV